jgi:hypothetical protein
MNKLFQFLCVFLFIQAASTSAISAQAQDQVPSKPWQQLQLVGEAELKFFFWHVYEARLYSNNGNFVFSETRPFALELHYKRKFSVQQLVDETRKQWKAIGIDADSKDNATRLNTLGSLLGDVDNGDIITLYVDAQGASNFYLNERLLGTIADSAFTEQFAAIWLSEKTTRPDFRDNLIRQS